MINKIAISQDRGIRKSNKVNPVPVNRKQVLSIEQIVAHLETVAARHINPHPLYIIFDLKHAVAVIQGIVRVLVM